MKNQKLITLSAILFLLFHPHVIFSQDKSANAIGNQGLALIEGGEVDKGLKLVKQATTLEPKNATWHMNYGSVLFGKGRSVLQAGNQQEAGAIFREVEQELLLAIQLFKEEDDLLKSHCYFLLGDISHHAFKDREKAQQFYHKALEYNPKHGGALKATGGVKPARKPGMLIRYAIGEDSVKWTIGHKDVNRTDMLVEFVPEGQSIEGWKEMVAQQVSYINAPLEAFIAAWKKSILEADSEVELFEKKMDETSICIIYKSKPFNEYSIRKFTQSTDGIYVLAYHIRLNVYDQARVDLWKKIVMEASLAPNP